MEPWHEMRLAPSNRERASFLTSMWPSTPTPLLPATYELFLSSPNISALTCRSCLTLMPRVPRNFHPLPLRLGCFQGQSRHLAGLQYVAVAIALTFSRKSNVQWNAAVKAPGIWNPSIAKTQHSILHIHNILYSARGRDRFDARQDCHCCCKLGE